MAMVTVGCWRRWAAFAAAPLLLLAAADAAAAGTASAAAPPNTCVSPAPTSHHPKPDVFYINLDRSTDRRRYMERQLAFYGYTNVQRIRAVTIKDVVVPQEVSRQQDCQTASNLTTAFVTRARMFNNRSSSSSSSPLTPPDYKIMVKTLCGRPKNTRRELIVTISHLHALRAAVNTRSSSPYALILEDDMNIGFDVDFHAMALAAPAGFGILQLVTSNDYDVKYLWERYLKVLHGATSLYLHLHLRLSPVHSPAPFALLHPPPPRAAQGEGAVVAAAGQARLLVRRGVPRQQNHAQTGHRPHRRAAGQRLARGQHHRGLRRDDPAGRAGNVHAGVLLPQGRPDLAAGVPATVRQGPSE